MALPFLLQPAVPLLQWHRTELGVEPGDDIPIDLRHGSEEKALSNLGIRMLAQRDNKACQ